MTIDPSILTDRRRFPRYALREGIEFSIHRHAGEAATMSVSVDLIDLSETGARIRSPESFDSDSMVNVQLTVPQANHSHSRAAYVRWVSPNSDGSLEVGLQWQQVFPEEELAGFVDDVNALIAKKETDGIVTTFFLKNQRITSPSIGTKAFLVHIYPKGPNLGKRHQLPETPVLLGRGNSCDISIADTTISRRHICMQTDGKSYEVIDLDSKNGTYVNDIPVKQQVLSDGDYLQVGSHIFRYLCGGNIEAEYHEEIYRLTIIDALTNIANKRYLFEFLDRELVRVRRYHRPLSVILFDIDHFKDINDRIGHLGGDFALRELASRVKTTVREDELLARFGGEEFVIVLPETSGKNASDAAERIRSLIERHEFCFGHTSFSITVSAGVATTPADSDLNSLELLHLADEQLYRAKHEGRNCVRGGD